MNDVLIREVAVGYAALSRYWFAVSVGLVFFMTLMNVGSALVFFADTNKPVITAILYREVITIVVVLVLWAFGEFRLRVEMTALSRAVGRRLARANQT